MDFTNVQIFRKVWTWSVVTVSGSHWLRQNQKSSSIFQGTDGEVNMGSRISNIKYWLGNIRYKVLNIAALILDWLQVKNESQDDSIQLQFKLSDAPKLGNLQGFSIVWFVCHIFKLFDLSGRIFWCLICPICVTEFSIVWFFCLVAPNTLAADRICMDWIGDLPVVWIVVFVTVNCCDLYPHHQTRLKNDQRNFGDTQPKMEAMEALSAMAALTANIIIIIYWQKCFVRPSFLPSVEMYRMVSMRNETQF